MRTLLFLASALTLAAQSIQVSGRVLTVDGQPIPEARITWRQVGIGAPLADPNVEPPFVTTNPDGVFSFRPSVAGQYRLDVTKAGWIPRVQSFTLKEGQAIRDLMFPLEPASFITGRVLDSEGKPVPKAMVTAFQYAYLRGERSLSASTFPIAAAANGSYEVPNLTAGRYYLRVEANGPAVTTYYPSTLDFMAASVIEIATGATQSNIDIRQRKEPLFRIRGKAVDEFGAPAANAALNILPEHPVNTRVAPPRVMTGADGSFEFIDLLPGRYVIRAIPIRGLTVDGKRVDAKYAGRASVTITNDNIDDHLLKVNGGHTLTGKLITEDGSPLPIPPAGLSVYLTDAEQPFMPSGLNGAITSITGTFRIDTIPPAKYYLAISPLTPKIYIKSIYYGGQDSTRLPIDLLSSGRDNLEIVLGVDAGRVDARVLNSDGQGMPRALVALWPDQPDEGSPNASVRVTFSAINGYVSFYVRPGRYRLAAFAEVEQAYAQSPDFLNRFRASAAEIVVGDGAYVHGNLEPISREDAEAVIRNLP